ncbi:hypothetical protein GW17_00041632 [Ensete ventricosum]|nr:hypothetical protein GW17_00041632 [Ensete ventricosum]
MTPSSPPPAPFLDLNLNLNLAPFPKVEPKPEPPDHHPALPGPIDLLDPLHPTPGPSPSPSHDAVDDERAALFAEYLRLARLFAAAAASGDDHHQLSLVTAPTLAPTRAANSSAVVARKKRKIRSADMVRASTLGLRDQLYFRDVVRRTRITFDSLRSLLLRDENKADAFEAIWGKRSRPDLKAATVMGDRDLWLNRDRRIIGAIPGITIGDVFFFRMELCVLGLHGQIQAGIDYVPASRSSTGEPLATSIIVSGGYEDDEDSGLVLVYTGHGGRGPSMFKHCTDQKLEGGNLALERSMNYGIEIRVIRGIKSNLCPIGKIYVYDGLYKIVNCWMDVGKSGFGIYKYKLLRIEGQEEMGSGILKLAEDLKVNPLSMRPAGYLSLDISTGKEKFPVSLFNNIDDDREPLLFEYLSSPVFPVEAFQGKTNADAGNGCECISNCSASCYCAKKNGGEFAYGGHGILLRGKPLIYECGTLCQCPPSCPNRVSQRGMRHQLEVFRSKETGWGVRSLDLIRAGEFVCEFSGIMLTRQQTETLSTKGHCLVHPGQFPGRWVEWGDISDVLPNYVSPNFPCLPGLNFSIDVSRSRNVACYLSHSCSPNVFVQYVLFDHNNVSYPHVMIFAMENIPPLRELSVDYGIGDEPVGKLTM